MANRALLFLALTTAAWAQLPVSGDPVPQLAGLDAFMQTFLAKWRIPGATVAVSRNGELVYARGFGYADADARTPMAAAQLLRIASVSKPLTSVGVLKLVEQGKLSLDAKAFDLLSEYVPNPLPPNFDSRIRDITVRQLLHHIGGWDRDVSFDPMFRSVQAAQATGTTAPAGCPTIIRYMMAFRLDFAPGQRYAYSNFGYCILGRIIEKASSQSYEDYMLAIFRSMGIEGMRQGRTLLSQQLPGEARYHPYPGEPTATSVFPGGGQVPSPYGGFFLEALDAHGGWVGSAIDLVRFANAVDGRRGFPFLSSASVSEMIAQPPSLPSSATWYAKGWSVQRSSTDFNWFHDGSLPGTQTILVRYGNGLVYAALLNMRPQDSGTSNVELQTGVNTALSQVTSWPTVDRFSQFAPGNRPVIAPSRGVENGASYTAGFTPGGWVQIKGTGLATTTRTWQSSDFRGDALPTSLDGIEVRINGKLSAVYFISPEQINVQAPDDTLVGRVWVQVSRSGAQSEPVPATLVRNAPALFQYGPEARPLAVAVHLDGSVIGNPAVVAGTTQATRGERILLFGSNFAASPAGRILSAPIPLADVSVTVGGVPATVEFCAAISPGLFQINLLLPANVPIGDQEVVVTVNGVSSKAGVALAVKE